MEKKERNKNTKRTYKKKDDIVCKWCLLFLSHLVLNRDVNT